MPQKRPVKEALTAAVKAKRKVAKRDEAPKAAAVVISQSSEQFEVMMPDLFAALRDGLSVSKVARQLGVSAGQLRSYAWRHHRDEYEQAQRDSADILAEKALESAAEAHLQEDVIETTYADGSVTTAVKRFDNVPRSKVAADTLLKLAAAKDPERYGSKAASTDSTAIAGEIAAARRRVTQSS